DPAPLEQVGILDDPAATTAAGGTRPVVDDEPAAVEGLEPLDDASLQLQQPAAHLVRRSGRNLRDAGALAQGPTSAPGGRSPGDRCRAGTACPRNGSGRPLRRRAPAPS